MANSCSACGKTFASSQSLSQHVQATGHQEPTCSCGKTFRTQRALDQHCEATGHHEYDATASPSEYSDEYDSSHEEDIYECGVCGREFFSSDALRQHEAAKGHHADDEYEIEVPEAPVDSPGEWVLREDFNGRKSFGFYMCDCGRFWTSAHGYRDYRQGCQGCETESLPHFMWKNFGTSIRKDKDDDDEKPHDASRCEACRLGECHRGLFGY